MQKLRRAAVCLFAVVAGAVPGLSGIPGRAQVSPGVHQSVEPNSITSAVSTDQSGVHTSPSENRETVIPSHGANLLGVMLLASGPGPHPTVLLLHGFPGYEQNMDLAQALRRDGWNVLAMHYRGAWGSGGSFSFSHATEDIATMVQYITANALRLRVDRRHLVVVGHSMGGFLTVEALADNPQLEAGVVISGASPVDNAEDYFGGHPDPADMAPLAGTSLAALKQDAEQHAAAWRYVTLAAKIAPRPVLDISANDGLRPANEALTAALEHAGCPVASMHMDTDHSFSDHRIALETAVLQWLDTHAR